MPRPTRRAVVAAAAGGLAGVLGGCSAAPSRPAGAPSRPERTSTTTAAPTATTTAAPTATPDESSVTRGSFRSSAVGREVGFRIVRPPGHGSADGAAHPLPLVLGLHGFGGDADSVLDLGVARMLAERARAGAPALAVVTVDGGTGSYYHRRADGTDAAAMITGELVPRIGGLGCDTARLGLYGLSMGGYGALLLAARHPGLARAVAVSSPALWRRPGDAPAVAFDSAADFARHSVWDTARVWRRVPLSVGCGRSDPFHAAARAFADRMPVRERRFDAGGHDAAYWSAHLPAQLDFLGSFLHAG